MDSLTLATRFTVEEHGYGTDFWPLGKEFTHGRSRDTLPPPNINSRDSGFSQVGNYALASRRFIYQIRRKGEMMRTALGSFVIGLRLLR